MPPTGCWRRSHHSNTAAASSVGVVLMSLLLLCTTRPSRWGARAFITCAPLAGRSRAVRSSRRAVTAAAGGGGGGEWAYRLVLLRHGESTWNRDNRYIGWTDVPLTGKGEAEASQAGLILKRAGVEPDHVYTSYLKRAIKTAWLALGEMGREYVPETRAWQLNERMYGLAGLTPQEAYAKHGEAQVRAWAKSLTEAPPEVAAGGECDPRREVDKYGALAPPPPRTESLRDVQARMVRYWDGVMQPRMQQKRHEQQQQRKGPAVTFFLVSHANAIRALMAHLDGLQTPEEIWAFEVPRAVPIVYHFDYEFRPVRVGKKTDGEDIGGMHLPAGITATVLLPPTEGDGDVQEGEGWAARLPSNS